MSRSRMRERCPDHLAIGRATLRGYKMIINGDARANIVKATDELVIGQLYQISESDDRKLRETATEFKFSRLEAIDVESEHGRKVTCFTYISANNEPGEPSREYAELLAKGCTIDAMLPGWYSDRYIWPWIEELVDRKTGKAKTL
jgi:AIG2-like family